MKKINCIFLLLLLILSSGLAEISSLSQLFLLGKGTKDLDGDALPEKIAISIIIPDNPTTAELIIAAELAARANLESLVGDFSLVKSEAEVDNFEALESPIFIGNNLKFVKEWLKENRDDFSALEENQGMVGLFVHKNRRGMALVAGSDDALLQTGRSFFLRWPYFWEIWGRAEGETYFKLEDDLSQFLAEEGINLYKTIIKAAIYEFPFPKSVPSSLKKLSFNSGEIKELFVEVHFTDYDDQEKAAKALQALQKQHQKGKRTELLTYPGCAQITFELRHGKKAFQVSLARPGYPKRILTPSFKDIRKPDVSGKNFDLLSLFTVRGFYSDSDKDGLPDGLDTSIILPKGLNARELTKLASRLVLPTTGASFPLISLDEEIDNNKGLIAPILIGQNRLTQELIKTGKLKLPALGQGLGWVKIVPKAFNASNALVFIGSDQKALEKTLSFFSLSFPYFEDFREGTPQLQNLAEDMEKFLKGELGAAESYFEQNLRKIMEDLQEKELEYLKVELFLPQASPKYEEALRKNLIEPLKTENIEIKTFSLGDGKKIWEKEKEFSWEVEEVLEILQEKIKNLEISSQPLKISVGVSESPQIRQNLKKRIEELLGENKAGSSEVEVLSSYKQGFFWLLEKVASSLKNKRLSRFVVKFAQEKDDFSKLKRFYHEPLRWLQELYPVDEILSSELNLPLDKIEFEIKAPGEPIYEVFAYDDKNNLFFHQSFTPRTKETPFLKVMPEWGTVKLTTGWIRIERGSEVLFDSPLKSDLEKFWDYYQEEVLSPLYSFIMKKTGNDPAFSKQPYFKKLQMEIWFSEPDYRLGLDEEIISSLEAIHDELYFDTLDFLRGITEIDTEEKEIPDDTSRYSAPGNVLPVIHPSLEGQGGKVKVTLEDWQASAPQLQIIWKEQNRDEASKKIIFPQIKPKTLHFPAFLFNSEEDRMESLLVEVEFEGEKDYFLFLELLATYRELVEKDLLAHTFNYPRLKSLTLKIRFKDLEKEEQIPVFFKRVEEKPVTPAPIPAGTSLVPDETLSPEACLEIVHKLSQNKMINTYIGGLSFEKRKIPVVEIFRPLDKYTSWARLLTFKPTLLISGRQHANEVSSTNYILKFAELLGNDPIYQEYTKKVNFVLLPMENPDGALLAYELQKLTPFHSLHAGRYSLLGMDVGAQINVSRPILPEALVRKNLFSKWLPDIYLNLHGYPSHEWVQQFSNYSPYLFRDYWIPKGWFAFFRTLSLPIYPLWKKAGEDLRKFIIDEIEANPKIKESNRKFYDRYYRWAVRWQPHLHSLELYDGVNIYAKRRSSQEAKLTPRTRITYIEETPEVMDETAHDLWLNFLCQQGLTYLKAHAKYLAQAKFEIARIEEEISQRIRIQFLRSRPPH